MAIGIDIGIFLAVAIDIISDDGGKIYVDVVRHVKVNNPNRLKVLSKVSGMKVGIHLDNGTNIVI